MVLRLKCLVCIFSDAQRMYQYCSQMAVGRTEIVQWAARSVSPTSTVTRVP